MVLLNKSLHYENLQYSTCTVNCTGMYIPISKSKYCIMQINKAHSNLMIFYQFRENYSIRPIRDMFIIPWYVYNSAKFCAKLKIPWFFRDYRKKGPSLQWEPPSRIFLPNCSQLVFIVMYSFYCMGEGGGFTSLKFKMFKLNFDYNQIF